MLTFLWVTNSARPGEAFQGADIAARWCSAPSRNCPLPHVAVLYVQCCLAWSRHTTLLQNWPRALLPAKLWDNFTVLRIHTGLLFPSSLSGRGRGQENPSCGCCKAASSLPLPITQLCTHLPPQLSTLSPPHSQTQHSHTRGPEISTLITY